jgi:DNA-binding transcriptional LysR family regulator
MQEIWKMELRHLRYFVAVAEERHITRAAARLGIQQPPLSQQIHALERELGAQLLRRLPRGVELTEAGRALLADARSILAHVDHAVAATRRTARGEQGRIAIGFTSSAPFHPLVPRVVRAFRDAHPRVSLSMQEGGSPDLIDALRNERLDAVFIRTEIANPEGLACEPLLQEAMVVALPKRHALARRNRVALPLKALADETLIVYRLGSGPGLYDAIVAACHAAGFTPRIGQEAPRVVSTLNFVAAGLGVSIVPESLARMRLDGVAFRRIRGAAAPRAVLNLVSRRGDASAALQRFLAAAKRAAANRTGNRGGP